MRPPLLAADRLFATFNSEVGTWIDDAFLEDRVRVNTAALEQQRSRLEQKLEDTKLSESQRTKIRLVIQSLTLELDDKKLLMAEMANKPAYVQEIEAIAQADLDKERETQHRVQMLLEGFRLQVALMKDMAKSVDQWLAIDVSVTQEQVDQLREAFKDAASVAK